MQVLGSISQEWLGTPDELASASSGGGSGPTLIVFAGQSQAEGVGLVFNLSAPNAFYATAYANVPYLARVGDPTDPPTLTDISLRPLQSRTFNSADRIGYEHSVLRILDRSHPLQWAAANNSLSATGFSVWGASSTFPTIGPNWAHLFITYVQSAMTQTGSSKVIIVFEDGGTDAGGAGTAAAWKTQMDAFAALVRLTFPACWFVIVRLNTDEVNNSGVAPFGSTVQAQQDAFVAGDAHAKLVNPDSITPVGSDHIHPSADQYVTGYAPLIAIKVAEAAGISIRPIANFSAAPVGLTVNFTDLSTSLPSTIASWAWAFGDGGTSTAQNPSHTYASGGTPNVQLTVTDAVGAQDTIIIQIGVASWSTDATSTWAIPKSSSEWTAFLASISDSDGNPGNLYFADAVASGNWPDLIGSLPLTVSGTGIAYQQTESGWASRSITFTDAGTGAFTTTDASQTDLNTADELIFLWGRFSLAALRQVLSLGTPTGAAARFELTATSKAQIVVPAGTVFGSTNPISATPQLVALQISATNSSAILFTQTEKLVGTWNATLAGKRFTAGNFARSSPQQGLIEIARFTGIAARRNSTKIKAIFAAVTHATPPWS